MTKKPSPRNYRDLCISARDGSLPAIRALLKHQGKTDLVAEVRRGRPLAPRVTKMIDALCAGVGDRDRLSTWEELNERGEIENLLDPWNGAPPHLHADDEE